MKEKHPELKGLQRVSSTLTNMGGMVKSSFLKNELELRIKREHLSLYDIIN